MDSGYQQLIALAQIIMIDVALAGDNAIVVGVAASRAAPQIRARVIFWGIAVAVLLRILFAGAAAWLFATIGLGLTLAGGILLLGVCWKIFRELRGETHQPDGQAIAGPSMGFWNAVGRIIVADLSMSLDNVLAVAGAAKGDLPILAVGLVLSILLMAVAATFIAKLLARYPWIAWLGLAIIVFVAFEMIWRGLHGVASGTGS